MPRTPVHPPKKPNSTLPQESGASGAPEISVPSRAVILAGGDSAALFPLTERRQKTLLPVLDRPLLDWQIEALVRNGVTDVGIVLTPDAAEPVRRHLRGLGRSRVRLHFAEDRTPRGPAGSLTLLDSMLRDGPFYVLDCNTFLGRLDLETLALVHAQRGAAATFGVLAPPLGSLSPEAVIQSDGTVREILLNYRSDTATEKRPLAGVCVLAPSVFERIPEDGFLDIKEGLFEELRRSGETVIAEPVRGLCVPVDSLPQYLHLQTLALQADMLDDAAHSRIAERTWVGEGTRIDPAAYIVGPVAIGARCVIEAGAHVIGPAVLGDDCQVGRDSLVKGSHLWNDVRLDSGCRIENAIVASGATLSHDTRLEHTALLPESDDTPEQTVLLAGQTPIALLRQHTHRSRLSRSTKAVFDFVGAAFLLILLAPIFPLCALAIWIDSGGPMFFRQLRCGRDGKPFWMLKFRTMVVDAEELRDQLEAENEVDGPVFKITNDPRVTRVGAFLRKTSLDELPQLVNVLRGEMSLVGPRPLEEDEMRFSPAWRDRRLSVKPGVTGLWQVSGRSKARFHDWVRYDIEYTKTQSLWLDIKILAKTVAVVFRRSGAY